MLILTVVPWCVQIIDNAVNVDAPERTSAVGEPLPPSTRATPPTFANAEKLESFTVIGPPLVPDALGAVGEEHPSSTAATAARVAAPTKVRRLTTHAAQPSALANPSARNVTCPP
ncbi:hypothetical protein LBMAG44_20530 [Gemmatimonadota bacterium]|nr:hypothetical protein LBMAG44_20530 [Gemmatimonadota bacterium]